LGGVGFLWGEENTPGKARDGKIGNRLKLAQKGAADEEGRDQ